MARMAVTHYIKLFTNSHLLNLHPWCRIRETKWVQPTMALYQYKLFNLFQFSVIEFCEVVMFKPWTQYVWSKTGILFFLPTLVTSFQIFCLGLRPFDFYYKDGNAPRFSLHLDDSVVREIRPENQVHWLFFLLLLLFWNSSCSESQINFNVFVCSVVVSRHPYISW